jgi:hypothetical protein
MKKLSKILITGILALTGCSRQFSSDPNPPRRVDISDVLVVMNQYHGGLDKRANGGKRDFDGDGINDAYYVGKDGTIYAQLTSVVSKPREKSFGRGYLARLPKGSK